MTLAWHQRPGPGSPPVIVRTYKGHSQQDAAKWFTKDASMFGAAGYVPVSQSWAQGSWGCGSFALALLLCFLLVGIFVFIYMLVVKPAGTLTVTYQRQPGY